MILTFRQLLHRLFRRLRTLLPPLKKRTCEHAASISFSIRVWLNPRPRGNRLEARIHWAGGKIRKPSFSVIKSPIRTGCETRWRHGNRWAHRPRTDSQTDSHGVNERASFDRQLAKLVSGLKLRFSDRWPSGRRRAPGEQASVMRNWKLCLHFSPKTVRSCPRLLIPGSTCLHFEGHQETHLLGAS